MKTVSSIISRVLVIFELVVAKKHHTKYEININCHKNKRNLDLLMKKKIVLIEKLLVEFSFLAYL